MIVTTATIGVKGGVVMALDMIEDTTKTKIETISRGREMGRKTRKMTIDKNAQPCKESNLYQVITLLRYVRMQSQAS